MNFCGISDSFASLASQNPPCPECASTSRVAKGLCLRCLFSCGLLAGEAETESLDSLLAEIDIPDTDWQVGNYQILEELGRGGMGVIYRARQQHSHRIVALKRILSFHSDSAETLARFQREAEAAASLDHPNILPIHEVGRSKDGLPFFSMKFAPGGSLLDAAGAFRNRPRQVVQLLMKVARAVDYAHNQGILHRDLKPGNILLDAHGEPLVSDFGLAKWLDTKNDLTRSLTIFGTPGYIAPEQSQTPPKTLTPAVDVYSLGAILFELLAGRPPFLGEHAIAVIRQAAEKPPPKLRSVAAELDRDLETICARCLEPEPTARYHSAGDLADDLVRWLEGRPTVARPVPPAIHFWRWSLRNPALACSLAICCLFGAAAIAWQTQSRHLKLAAREQMLAAHSVAALPFLNLESGGADSHLAKTVATALKAQMPGPGPARIVALATPSPKWTGTGSFDEVRLAAQQTNGRAVLAGLFRPVNGRTRISLRLLRGNGTDVLGTWTLEINKPEDVRPALIAGKVAASLYRALEAPTGITNVSQTDPAMKDPVARGYLKTGRALLDRRTIPDIDRAITCFEEASRAAPRSASARSYLAMAYIGRNFLSANPIYVERALRAADDAILLSPDDSIALRGLCFLYTSTGHFDKALEQGLRSLESGDPSERTFGQIGFIWKEMGRPDIAMRWFLKAKVSQIQPADYDALLGDCWMLLSEDSKAQQAYETALTFRPELPEGWLGLCNLKVLSGDFDGARELFRERSTEYEAFPSTKLMEARIELFARNFRTAERLFEELHRDDPHGVGAQQYGAISNQSALARLKIAAGDVVSANRLLEECIAEDKAELAKSPRHPETLYRLAADEAIRANSVSALTYLQASIAAGWTDYRSAKLDPRFDQLSGTPEFQNILSEIAARLAKLGRQSPAAPAVNEN